MLSPTKRRGTKLLYDPETGAIETISYEDNHRKDEVLDKDDYSHLRNKIALLADQHGIQTNEEENK